MNVVVTGAGGFVGREFSSMLPAAGHYGDGIKTQSGGTPVNALNCV